MSEFAINRFNSGIFSKKMAGRPEYKGSAQECLNFIPATQGYLYRRGGTRYLFNVGGDKHSRLYEFVYDKKTAYVLLFMENIINIYRNREYITSVITTYSSEMLNDLYFYQNGDVLYICSPVKPLSQLVRTSDTTFTFSDVSWKEPPYLLENTTDIRLSSNTSTSTVGANVVITSSAALFSNNDIGRYIRMTTTSASATKTVWGQIVGFTSATSITMQVKGGEVFSGYATLIWRLSAFSDSTGYPTCVCVHENRLFLGFKKYVFMSVSGQFNNFQLTDKDNTVLDTYGASIVLNMEKSNGVLWLYSDFQLLCGANSEEYTIKADNYGTALTPKNITAKVSSREGSEFIPPVMLDNGVIFVKKFGRKIISFAYSAETLSYLNSNLSRFSEEITFGKIWEMSFCNDLQPVLWIIKENGELLSCTLSSVENVVAFARHNINGDVVSICSVPEGEREALYLLVRRQIDGQTKFYLEIMEQGLEEDATDTKDAFFVDCGITLENETKTTEFSGLDHLEGKTVQVLADGAVEPECTVENGAISIQYPANKIQVGLGYESVYSPSKETLADFVLELHNKRVNKVLFKIYKTVGLQVGSSYDNMTQVPFRNANDRMDEAVSLKTDNRKFYPNGGWEQDGEIWFAQKQPLPCTVLALYFDMRF